MQQQLDSSTLPNLRATLVGCREAALPIPFDELVSAVLRLVPTGDWSSQASLKRFMQDIPIEYRKVNRPPGTINTLVEIREQSPGYVSLLVTDPIEGDLVLFHLWPLTFEMTQLHVTLAPRRTVLFTDDEMKFLLQHNKENEVQRKAASDLHHGRFAEFGEKGLQRLQWHEEIVDRFLDRLVEERQWGKVIQGKDEQPIQIPEVPKPQDAGWDAVFDWYYTHGEPRRMPVTELATKIGYTTRYVYNRRDEYDSRHGIKRRKRQHKKA